MMVTSKFKAKLAFLLTLFLAVSNSRGQGILEASGPAGTELREWPMLLLTLKAGDDLFNVTLVDPNANTTHLIKTENGLEFAWLKSPVSVGSEMSKIVCHERWTFSCRTIDDDRRMNLTLLLGVDDSEKHVKNNLHLDLNPFDGVHIMYLEPIRQAVWILNLRKNIAKLIGTFDDQNVVKMKVDWANGLLFTTTTSVVSVYGIHTDKLQPHDAFTANATYLAVDATLRLVYWTDESGSIFQRHYDQREITNVASFACISLAAGFSPLYVHNGSVNCIHRESDSQFSTLKRYGGATESRKILVNGAAAHQDQLLHYNIYTADLNDSQAKVCNQCSHLCIPVNTTDRFVCACPYGFRLINAFECEHPAVLAAVVDASQSSKNTPDGADYALQLIDFMSVPPSTRTYAYESSPFRIVLSDTFQQLCLQFSSNRSVECFSPFGGSNRSVVRTYKPDETVLKVTGNSRSGFDVYFGSGKCFRVHRTNVNQTYTLSCSHTLEDHVFENSFIDHLRQKMYYLDEDGLNIHDVTGSKILDDSKHKLAVETGSRRFFVELVSEIAMLIPGLNNELRHISIRDRIFQVRNLGSSNAQTQLLIYKQNTLYLDDSRIVIMDKEKMAGAEIIRASDAEGSTLEFTIVEKVSSDQEPEIPDPCQSQTECRHLCKSDENLKSYECFCPFYMSISGMDVCKPSLLTLALADNQKFELRSNVVRETRVNRLGNFPNSFRFAETFLFEPSLQRICVARCLHGPCEIECSTYGENAKLQKFITNSTRILHFANRRSYSTLSDQVYWISDESENELNRMCLNVGSPGRRSWMRLSCFSESALMSHSLYDEVLQTVFWLKSESDLKCRLRGIDFGLDSLNTSKFIQGTTFRSNCHGLAVSAETSKLYVLTWLALHEFDVSTHNSREIRSFGFYPSDNVLKVLNDFVFTVGTSRDSPDEYFVIMFGLVSKTGNITYIYGSSDKKKIVDVHIEVLEEPGASANSGVSTCTLSCKFHCDTGTENVKPRCLCPLSPLPSYGRQYEPCGEYFPEKHQNPQVSETFDAGRNVVLPTVDTTTPWWPFLLGVLLIVTLAGACQAFFWRRMKNRQDLLFQRAVSNFMEGSESKARSAKSESERALHLPFTAVIPPGQLKVSETCLGEGNFGQVYKGEFHEKQVAIKTVKDNLDTQVVQDFLKELKIMTYVGFNANIVEFFGAEVSGIKKGLVRVVLELCGRGSLESVLRGFTDIVNLSLPNTNNEQRKSGNTQETTRLHNSDQLATRNIVSMAQLKFWAQQIASGMDYLEKKNVVHGDLATRNVLVCEDMTVKISDFGFSKNMYQSETYRKKKACPLPWRWASPETLSRLEFSFKADVWSYGVTVWEIFSLGAVPFPDLTWDNEFTNNIQQGLRPPQPQRMPSELFRAVVVPCWNLVPAERPSFSTLVDLWSL